MFHMHSNILISINNSYLILSIFDTQWSKNITIHLKLLQSLIFDKYFHLSLSASRCCMSQVCFTTNLFRFCVVRISIITVISQRVGVMIAICARFFSREFANGKHIMAYGSSLFSYKTFDTALSISGISTIIKYCFTCKFRNISRHIVALSTFLDNVVLNAINVWYSPKHRIWRYSQYIEVILPVWGAPS